MKKEEITSLAREYAEEEGKHDIQQGFGEAFAKDMLEFNEKEFKSVLEFLLRRYFLVEKERVKDEYEKAKMDMVSKYHQGSMVVLQVLFPEIGKEVEE